MGYKFLLYDSDHWALTNLEQIQFRDMQKDLNPFVGIQPNGFNLHIAIRNVVR